MADGSGENTLFILKNKAVSLRSAEKFLQNRGWSVSSGISLRELIAYLIQMQPKFILIPADFPNKKVKLLPKLLQQAFPVTIVGYVELASSQAVTLLADMKLRFQILPPVSGPQIERTLLRAQKELLEEAEYQAKQGAQTESSEKSPGFLKFAGEAKSSGVTHISGADEGAAKAGTDRASLILQELLGQEERQDSSAVSDSELSNDDILRALAERGLAEQNRRNAAKSAKAPIFNQEPPLQTPPADQATSPESFQNQDTPSAPNPSHPEDPNNSSGVLEPKIIGRTSQTEPSQSSQPLNAFNIETGTEASTPTGPETDKSNEGPQANDPNLGPYTRPKRKTPLYEYDPTLKRNRPTPQMSFKDSLPKLNQETILVKGTKYALDRSVRVIPYLPDYEEVQETKNCVCLTIQSDQFAGYLVAAFGYNRKIDIKFFKIVQEKLLTFLKSYGESPKSFESMAIEIQEVEFEEWAMEQAEFLRKSIHGDTEIAMAFFPSAETQLKIGDSVSKKMLALNLEEIRGDSQIEFDTYLFMPNNNRYLLYVASNGILYHKQKDRLKKAGIESLHIRKEAVPHVKKYKTQNFLNDRIETFKKKEGPGKKKSFLRLV